MAYLDAVVAEILLNKLETGLTFLKFKTAEK